MSLSICDLLPLLSGDGPTQMAADEALLDHAAAAGRPAVRFYIWQPATLSLGYFQPTAERLADPQLAALPYVRRASGGGAIIHQHELTYAVALPPGAPWQTGESWICRMHDCARAALAEFSVSATLIGCGHETGRGAFVCFRHQTPGDLLLGGHKIAGSAQRKRAGHLLQHGSILLAASPHAPHLPGVRELGGRELEPGALVEPLGRAFAKETGWRLEPAAGHVLAARTAELVAAKYCQPAWNDKR